jgi:hypothetical protein
VNERRPNHEKIHVTPVEACRASERHCPTVQEDAPAEWCVCIAAAWEERRVNERRPNHEDSLHVTHVGLPRSALANGNF